jgi:hypothetical protein
MHLFILFYFIYLERLTPDMEIMISNPGNSVHWLKVERSQSRQSPKLFLQSSELGIPQTLNRRRVYPGSGGRGTLAGERRVGRVPIPMRRHTLRYSSYILYCMYFVGKTLEVRFFYSSKIPASGSGNGYFMVHFPVEKNGPYLIPCVAY